MHEEKLTTKITKWGGVSIQVASLELCPLENLVGQNSWAKEKEYRTTQLITNTMD